MADAPHPPDERGARRALPSRAARARDGFSLLVVAALALVAMVLVVHVAMRALGVAPQADGGVPPETVQQALLAQGAGNLAVIALWLLVPGARPIGGRRWVALAPLIYVLFLVVLWVPGTVLYAELLQRLGTELPQQPHMRWFFGLQLETAATVGALLVVVLVGPIAEEMLFRGWMQGGLRLLLGPTAAVVLTAVLFGALHGLLLTLPLGLLGFLFGWLRERSGGLAAPVLAHMLHNTIMVVLAMQAPDLMRMLDGR